MNKAFKTSLKHIFITLGILSVCFILSLFIQGIADDSAVIPAIFVLGVFLTSVSTDGYRYGIAATLISVAAVNFAFTFPFFKFDFTLPENIISAAILLMVTVITCSLTTKIKNQENEKAESEAEKMRANLLRAVSHDLRTPLTTIYGSSSALLDSYDNFTPEQCKQMLGGITEDAEWLIRMVENLLSVTRLDGSNVKIIKTNTALDELIDSVLVKFAKRYPNQQIDVSIPDEFILIPMDALLIEQVIMNLLENSVRHAVGMTKLCLNVFTASDKVIFEIKDNGCGIPRDNMKNIFAGRYSVSPSARPDNGNNAGIGLSVCASIVKAHGGEIKAENLKSGGCAFRFSLHTED